MGSGEKTPFLSRPDAFAPLVYPNHDCQPIDKDLEGNSGDEVITQPSATDRTGSIWFLKHSGASDKPNHFRKRITWGMAVSFLLLVSIITAVLIVF